MPRTVTLVIASAALALGSFADLSSQAADAARFWPQWRGPHFKGVSTTANPPVTWSESKNIAWKAPLPGRGNSTPVVWGDRLFVTSAVPAGVTGDAQHTPRGGLPQRGTGDDESDGSRHDAQGWLRWQRGQRLPSRLTWTRATMCM